MRTRSVRESRQSEVRPQDSGWPELYRKFDESFVKEEKTTIAQTLKDPTSATFSKLKYVENLERRSRALCGEVNAKNSYGGYVGSKPFFSLLAPRDESDTPVWTTWTMQTPNANNMKSIDRKMERVKLAMSYCEDKAAKVTPLVE